ncbi:hypothetical protein [Microvirga arabica]|uniref:hypothetical protein n=1 Tax=Microvirga arabica TaxID=1128671 RepID=UPI001939A7CC|nr:hypothetical protein [Microvirga arabica]MBM1170092.1 hypothetical protein [Microvirga arabica]
MLDLNAIIDGLAQAPGENARDFISRLRGKIREISSALQAHDPHAVMFAEARSTSDQILERAAVDAVSVLVSALAAYIHAVHDAQQAAAQGLVLEEKPWVAPEDQDTANRILEEIAAPEPVPAEAPAPTPARARPALRPNVPNPHLNRPANANAAAAPALPEHDGHRGGPGAPAAAAAPAAAGPGVPRQHAGVPAAQAPAAAPAPRQGGGLGHLRGRPQPQQAPRPARPPPQPDVRCREMPDGTYITPHTARMPDGRVLMRPPKAAPEDDLIPW